MMILHIGWYAGVCHLWGECEASAEAMRSGRVTWGHTGRSPFDPGDKRLLQAFCAVVENDLPAGTSATELSLKLPSRRDEKGVLPKPSLRFLSEETTACPTLIPYVWKVSARILTGKPFFALMGRIHERRLTEDVFAGEDILRWRDLFRYAGALVARGRFLPGLVRTGTGDYEARWQPSLDRTEMRRFRQLASALPPVAMDEASPLMVADAFLNETVDRLVRFSVVTTLSRAQAEHGNYYSVHDAWFAALRGERPSVRWENSDEVSALQSALSAWRRPVEGRDGGGNEAWRLTLETPARPDDPWFLRIAQGGPEDQPGVDTRPLPSEDALVALGQAAMLFAPLGRAETDASGFGCRLSVAEAYALLSSSGLLLTAAGFDLRLPAWWHSQQAQTLSLSAELAPKRELKDEAALLEEKVEVRCSVLINGEPVTDEELAQLLQTQTPLVYFRGRWVHVDVRQIQDALRAARQQEPGERKMADAIRLALGVGEGLYGLTVSSVQGSGWLDTFLKRLSGEQVFAPVDVPSAFQGELRPYQLRGYSWLVCLRTWGFGACLADDMGLGKTIQALAFLLHERARGEKKPVLLVAPMSVLGNWLYEARRFAPALRCLMHHGPSRSHGDTWHHEAQDADVVITSYHLLYRDYADLRTVDWSGILLDEAQNIKNPDTHQAQAARALTADYRIALTGTPMENHVGDLWSLMDFLNPGLLGRRQAFRDTFFRPIQTGTDPGARTRLRRITAPFILRRLKTDKHIISDLPAKIENNVHCLLTGEQARLYRDAVDAFHREVEYTDDRTRRGLILAVLTRLKQICNHPAHYLGEPDADPVRSGKMLRLEEMLEETIERGESSLVFTQYARMGALLNRRLCRVFARDMPFLSGETPRQERDRMVRSFQESSEPQVFVLSLKAGGIGLNLTHATHVFHYDRWWNPAVENQATDRAFRIGQTQNVMVHKLLCSGTLEERIDALIAHKTKLADEIVTSGEAALTELSNEELHALLSLSETDVMEDA